MDTPGDHGETERLWNALRRDLRRHGADEHTADDIAQETWLIATQTPPQDRTRFQAWLWIVGIRLLRRSRSREGQRTYRELFASRGRLPYVENDRPSDESSGSLLAHLSQLPELYSTVLRLRFLEDLEVDEIARMQNVSRWTVHTRIQRGLARMRARLGVRERKSWTQGLVVLLWRGLGQRPSRPGLRAALVASILGLTLLLGWVWSLSREPSSTVVAEGPSGAPPTAPIADEPVVPEERASVASLPDLEHAGDAQRIRGVVRKPGGEPVGGARVHSLRLDGAQTELTAIADSLGRYEIAAGDLVWAGDEVWLDSFRCYVPSADLSLDVDLELLAVGKATTICVTTWDGKPVAGALILVDGLAIDRQILSARGRLEYSGPPVSTTTDASGCARLRLPVEGVELAVIAPGMPPWSRRVRSSELEDKLLVKLPQPIVLSGRCVDEVSKAPLWKVRVEVLQYGGLSKRTAETDTEGCFRIEGLAPGEMVLRAEEAGPGLRSGGCEARLSAERVKERCPDIPLSETHTLSGIAWLGREPAADAEVTIIPNSKPFSADRPFSVARTDDRGRFHFPSCSSWAYTVRIQVPGSPQPDFGVGRVSKGGGERNYSIRGDEVLRAPLVVEYAGPASEGPRLVEIEDQIKGVSLQMTPEPPGSARFVSPPLAEGRYLVVAWRPESGTFRGLIRHDPGSSKAHPLKVPESGHLVLAVELPEGVGHDDVEVSAPAYRFKRYGLGTGQPTLTRRVLPWSEEQRAFVGDFPLGDLQVDVGGPKLSDAHHVVRIAPGTTNATLRAEPGVEVTLVFQGSGRRANIEKSEHLKLECLSSSGVVRTQLSGADHRPCKGGFEYTLHIPASTSEVLASIRTPPKRTRRKVTPLRDFEGKLQLEPDALLPGAEHLFTIQLRDLTLTK